GAPRHTTDAVLAVRGLGRGGVARLAAARRRGLRRSPVPRRRVLRARGPRDARERAVVEPRGRGPRAARDGAARGSCPTRLAARRRRHAARGPASLAWAWQQGFHVSSIAAAAALVPPLLAWWPVRRLIPAADPSGM